MDLVKQTLASSVVKTHTHQKSLHATKGRKTKTTSLGNHVVVYMIGKCVLVGEH